MNKKALLAVLLVLLMLFTACGKTDSQDQTSNTKEATSAKEEVTSATEETTSEKEEETNKEVTNLKVAFLTTAATPADLHLVQDAINQKLAGLETYSTVEFLPINYGSYRTQQNLMLSSSDPLDLCVELGQYLGVDVAGGYFTQMDGLLEEHGAGIKTALGEDFLKCGQVEGKQYVVATIRDMATSWGFSVREDLVEKYDIDLSAIETIEDMTPVLEALSQEENIAPLGPALAGMSLLGQLIAYDKMGDGYGVLLDKGNSTTVTDWYATDEYEEYVNLMRSWYEAGYIYKDAATTQDSYAALIKGNKIAGFFNSQKPGIDMQMSLNTGQSMVTKEIIGGLSTTLSVNSVSWGIPHNTKDAVKAMQFLDLMYSNSEIVNMINYGIEGTHYVMVEGETNVIDFPEGITAENTPYNLSPIGWEFGNQLLSYVFKGNDPELWTKMKEFNDSATRSKAIGFVFDSTSVKTQVANVSNVIQQYALALEDGIVDPETVLPEFREALDKAGMNDIVAEKQAQLDVFLGQ
jgi:putative aldouronate transport system substrate-binding protein